MHIAMQSLLNFNAVDNPQFHPRLCACAAAAAAAEEGKLLSSKGSRGEHCHLEVLLHNCAVSILKL